MLTLASKLAEGLAQSYSSKGGAPLFFEEHYVAHKFAELFSIPLADREKFYEAFNIVTMGQGDELKKINSVKSSALLCLLTFYPLFLNEDKSKNIVINGVPYYKCFFEVRNRVIKNPSCVDIALVSTDGTKVLYLESKLSEYADDISTKEEYGKSYKALYEDGGMFERALAGELSMDTSKKAKLVLKSAEKAYIEGIKQTVSHIIGLVRGPQFSKQGHYPKKYYSEYKELYKGASELLFGTILFDPTAFEVNTEEFKAYTELYSKTIIEHAGEILECIEKWSASKSMPDRNKKIEVLGKVLTYQDLFADEHNRALLSKRVEEFYKL